jgi:hypothetical protein
VAGPSSVAFLKVGNISPARSAFILSAPECRSEKVEKRGFASMRKKLLGVAGATLLMCASGCATFEQSDFSSWVIGYNKSVERAQNESIFLNIIRSSYNLPLYFTGTQVVRGSGTTAISGGLGGSFSGTSIGGYAPSTTTSWGVTPSTNLSVDRNFNFDVAVADTAEFQQALLSPMKEDVMHFYSEQGLPHELLYHLLIEKLRVSIGGKQFVYENDPLSPSYPDFTQMLGKLLEYGLTTQVNADFLPVGPSYKQPDLRGLATVVQGGAFLLPARDGGFQVSVRMPTATFCFDPAIPENHERLPASMLCVSPDQQRGTVANSSRRVQFGDVSLYVQLRSTKAIFNYLGSLVTRQRLTPDAEPIRLVTKEALAALHSNACDAAQSSDCHAIFSIKPGRGRREADISVSYDGETYHLPMGDGSFTPIVLSILSQTLNLNKSVNSLPLIGTTLVK